MTETVWALLPTPGLITGVLFGEYRVNGSRQHPSIENKECGLLLVGLLVYDNTYGLARPLV